MDHARYVAKLDAPSRALLLRAIIDRELEIARAQYTSATDQRKVWLRQHAEHVKTASDALLLRLSDLAHVRDR